MLRAVVVRCAVMGVGRRTYHRGALKTFFNDAMPASFDKTSERERELIRERRKLYKRVRNAELSELGGEEILHRAIVEDNFPLYSNGGAIVDLHGCDRVSASCVVRYTLGRIAKGFGAVSRRSSNRKLGEDVCVVLRDLEIVTGVGYGSKVEGKSVLRPHIKRHLANAYDPPLSYVEAPDRGALIVRRSDIERWVLLGSRVVSYA